MFIFGIIGIIFSILFILAALYIYMVLHLLADDE